MQLFGAAGEAITLSARDGNAFPLESVAVPAGTLPVSSSSPVQINRTAWTNDTTFRAQAIAAEHCPPTQTRPALQALPHAPQWFAFVWVLTHWFPHLVPVAQPH